MTRMKPTCYIAGPMRGKPDFNRAAFNAAAKLLAEAGWHPINPVEIERVLPCVREDGTLDGVRLSDLLHAERAFVDRADAIYLLDGWWESVGARGELQAYLNSTTAGGRVMFEGGRLLRASEKGED